MKKKEILEHWRSMKKRRQLKVTPVPYKHRGSTFDEDGIRICGSQAFIDSILSRLTDLLAYENMETRLQVSYKQANDKKTGQPLGDSYTCYVQVHERGDEAKMVNTFASTITGHETIITKGY